MFFLTPLSNSEIQLPPGFSFHIGYVDLFFLFNEFLAFFPPTRFHKISCLISCFTGHCRRLIRKPMRWEDHTSQFRPLADLQLRADPNNAARRKTHEIWNVAHSHRFQEFQAIQKIRVFRNLRQVPKNVKNTLMLGEKKKQQSKEYTFSVLLAIVTGSPTSPSAPLSPWNKRDLLFVTGPRAFAKLCDLCCRRESTHIYAINSWDTCRSRGASRSFTILSATK